ncbi:MAG: SMI1/KNR4 family protein [Prosthecobacter sp.]|uniref:SMI1/KNR4 family protein n=1 Tax=Prosthecobacter sp. TaxID=1965333 RepID=UPI003900A672
MNNTIQSELPASEAALRMLVDGSAFELPTAYIELLRRSNGCEGDLNIDPGYLVLWKVEEVHEFNRDYEVPKWAPGFMGFGSNGGGELIAFDFRSSGDPRVSMIPMIGMEPDAAIELAPNFETFVTHLLSAEH